MITYIQQFDPLKKWFQILLIINLCLFRWGYSQGEYLNAGESGLGFSYGASHTDSFIAQGLSLVYSKDGTMDFGISVLYVPVVKYSFNGESIKASSVHIVPSFAYHFRQNENDWLSKACVFSLDIPKFSVKNEDSFIDGIIISASLIPYRRFSRAGKSPFIIAGLDLSATITYLDVMHERESLEISGQPINTNMIGGLFEFGFSNREFILAISSFCSIPVDLKVNFKQPIIGLSLDLIFKDS